jgi:hypothetical protein
LGLQLPGKSRNPSPREAGAGSGVTHEEEGRIEDLSIPIQELVKKIRSADCHAAHYHDSTEKHKGSPRLFGTANGRDVPRPY